MPARVASGCALAIAAAMRRGLGQAGLPGEAVTVLESTDRELVGAMASDSGGVKWSVLVGKTHEAVVTASAHKTGVWAAGLNAKSHPRSRGGSAIVKLENNETNRAWAPERLSAVLSRRGKQRV